MDSFVRDINHAFDIHPGTISKIDFAIPIVQQHSHHLMIYNGKHESCDVGYVKELVHRGGRFEIYIIRWAPGSTSKIHDHAEQGCIMKLLTGSLAETQFDPISLQPMKSSVYTTQTSPSFIHNSSAVHSVGNQSTDLHAVSVHIYAPPNHVARTFEK